MSPYGKRKGRINIGLVRSHRRKHIVGAIPNKLKNIRKTRHQEDGKECEDIGYKATKYQNLAQNGRFRQSMSIPAIG